METTVNVDLSKVDRSVIESSLAFYGEVGYDATNTLSELTSKLTDHFRSKDGEKFICTDCGGLNFKGDQWCSFCGADFVDKKEALKMTEAALSENVEVAEEALAPPEPVKMVRRPGRPKGSANNGKVKVKAKSGFKSLPGTKADASAIIKRIGRPKGTKEVVVLTAQGTESDLDVAVDEIRRLKVNGAVAMHELGSKIAEVHSQNLWLARRKEISENASLEECGSKWGSFKEFCDVELQMTYRNALRLIDVSRAFSREDVLTFGTTKLHLLLEAPAEARESIKQKIKETGLSKGGVVKEVRKARDQGGLAHGSKRESANEKIRKAHAAATEAARKNPGKLTMRMSAKPQLIPLFVKPTKDGFSWDDLEPAVSVDDFPVGRLETDQDVVIYFSVRKNLSDHLVLSVTAVREGEEEDSE